MIPVYFLLGTIVLIFLFAFVRAKTKTLFKERLIFLVKKHSKLYEELIKLNDSDEEIFYNVTHKNELEYWYKSKKNLDSVSMQALFNKHITENYDAYKKIIDMLASNKSNYESYKEKYNELGKLIGKTDVSDLKVSPEKFREVEVQLYKNGKHKVPMLKTRIRLIARYTSPAGRNQWMKDRWFSSNEIIRRLHEIENEQSGNIYNEIEWKWLNEKNKNDCWNHSLALALKQPYDYIRDKFSDKINKDGGLNGDIVARELFDNSYFSFKPNSTSLRDLVLSKKDKQAGYLASVNEHLLYIKGLKIYDTRDPGYYNLYLQEKVSEVFAKSDKSINQINITIDS